MEESRPYKDEINVCRSHSLTFPSLLPPGVHRFYFLLSTKAFFFPDKTLLCWRWKWIKWALRGGSDLFTALTIFNSPIWGVWSSAGIPSPAPNPSGNSCVNHFWCFQQEIWAIWELHSPEREQRAHFKWWLCCWRAFGILTRVKNSSRIDTLHFSFQKLQSGSKSLSAQTGVISFQPSLIWASNELAGRMEG